jgi:hypothetical protein
MASGTDDELSSIFEALSGGVSGIGGGVIGAISGASQSGGGSTAETVLGDVLKSGFGLMPIVSGLLSLFGGGSSTPEPLVDYQMPGTIDYQAAEVDGRIMGGDFDQSGGARAYSSGRPAVEGAGINVTVQAMDAQSFLDRSSDIAAAVRNAMLNLSPINDVVNDL